MNERSFIVKSPFFCPVGEAVSFPRYLPTGERGTFTEANHALAPVLRARCHVERSRDIFVLQRAMQIVHRNPQRIGPKLSRLAVDHRHRNAYSRGVPRSTTWLNSEALDQLDPGHRYLVGVSGGRDSVVLLHWLLARGFRRLIVCHVDHRLRGRSSAGDARFVRQLAEQHGLNIEVGAADVRAFAKENRSSIETAARALRYAFFFDVARRRRCKTIFLAHHADDLVETYLFNLFRGGARTMRPVSQHSLGKTQLTIVRPLLHVWREEINEYIRASGLKFREDSSNARLAATRNRVRHKIIPALEHEFGRGIRKAVWRAAIIADEEDALLESLVAPAGEKLNLHSLGKQPVALQRRAIRRWLQHNETSDISFRLIESVRALLDSEAGPAKVNLPRDRHVRRRAGKLFIE